MVVQFHSFKNILFVPELRKKIGFTLAVFAVLRFGAHVPIPGIDPIALSSLFGSGMAGGFLAYFDLFSGGALGKFAIFALGMSPYITSSLIIQIWTAISPTLEALSKEGETGRRVLNQYTRYLTLGLSLGQAFGIVKIIEAKPGIVLYPGIGFKLTAVLLLSVGSVLVMWLGEQINAHGIGNGSSAVIFAGIVAGLPRGVLTIIESLRLEQTDIIVTALFLLLSLGITMCVIFLEKGERKIPIQYAKRVVGNRVYGGQSSYIPFKINPVGVVPVIFSGAFLQLPGMIAALIGAKYPEVNRFVVEWFYQNAFLFNICNAILIVFFTFSYTSIVFNSVELADNIRKSGGFLPGLRPGRRTVEFFDYLLTRLGFTGAIYLAILVILPGLIKAAVSFPVMITGTSLLIVIGVALDTSAQIETHLIERRYDGFLTSGRLKGRRVRY